ncbi:MAG: hypothetical protein R3C49_20095 [Planctomycetaceae bacterium]
MRLTVSVSDCGKPIIAFMAAVVCLSQSALVDGQTPAPSAQTREQYQQQQRDKSLELRRNGKSLLNLDDLKNFKRDERTYRDLLRKGVNPRNQAELDALRVGLRRRILVLSDPETQVDPRDFETANKTLSRELQNAFSPTLIPDALKRKSFRELLCREAMELFRQLLKEGNLEARTSGMQRMLDLEVVPASGRDRIQMFDEVHTTLINVLTDPEQPEAVRAAAATTLKTYLQKAEAVPQVELAIAEGLAKEIDNPLLSAPYQILLLQAMEEVRAPRQVAGARKAPSSSVRRPKS